MAVPVHEAGAERLAVHIRHAAGAGRGAGGQHGGDGAAFHAHITVEPRVARAVDDLCIAEQNTNMGMLPHMPRNPRGVFRAGGLCKGIRLKAGLR